MRIESCEMQGAGMCPCPLEGITEVLIGKKWTISIIVTIANFGKVRFNQLSKKLHTISPKTLSDRLTELEKHGIVNKKLFAEIPPRSEYTLTEKGKKLQEALIPLMQWAVKQ